MLMWFDKEQSSENTRSAKNSLPLAGCTVVQGAGLTDMQNSVVVLTQDAKTYYVLTSQSPGV